VTLRFTLTARRQFLQALRFIATESLSSAERFRIRAEKVLRRLERFPHSGRRLPEFPDLPHREIIVRPYRFFYRVRGSTVWIVAVWHGAQAPRRPRATRRSGRRTG
jgi:plasmid stabilization system protein ParE